MERYVLGLFDTREDAEKAVAALDESALSEKIDYGLFARHEDFREGLNADDETSSVAASALTGAAAGGASGVLVGAVAGASLFLFPGLGPLLGAGALASALATTGISTGLGAAGGAFMGAIMGYGASEEEANFYMQGIQEGGALVVVGCRSDQIQKVSQILDDHGVRRIETRTDADLSRANPSALPPEDRDVT